MDQDTGHQGGAVTRWRKSRHSNPSGNCVELALDARRILVRDSYQPDGPVLVYAAVPFTTFLGAVRAGRFDGPSRSPALAFDVDLPG